MNSSAVSAQVAATFLCEPLFSIVGAQAFEFGLLFRLLGSPQRERKRKFNDVNWKFKSLRTIQHIQRLLLTCCGG